MYFSDICTTFDIIYGLIGRWQKKIYEFFWRNEQTDACVLKVITQALLQDNNIVLLDLNTHTHK